MTIPTLIYLNMDKHNQGLPHLPFVVSLDRFNGICNTLNYFSSRIYVLNKIHDAK